MLYLCRLCGFILFALIANVAYAQIDIFIANGDSIYIHSEDSVGLYSSTLSDGIVSSTSGSNLIFLGESWENNASARFPGDGRFTFQQPSSLGLNVNQKLGGVNWDNRFPNMILRNANDLNLTAVAGSRDTFTFDTGCVIHDLSDFVIGDGYPGIITGYKETKYFVTNHDQSSDTGFLVRHNVGATDVDFPVGSAKVDYTPARFSNTGVPDTFYVRVFPNVYEFGTNGGIVNDITVQRTWNILEETPGGSSVDLTLQHNASTEGGSYGRSDQYLSRYLGTPNNAYRDSSLGRFWDYAAPGNGYANTLGTITTGSPVGFQATRTQQVVTSFSKNAPTRYFTKGSTANPIPIELIYLSANWINNERSAHVTWATGTELNNMGFEVYRSYDALSWDFVTSEPSKAVGGNSFEKREYIITDNEISASSKTVYYKLIQRDFDEKSEGFGPVRLDREATVLQLDIVAFPNPTKSKFYLNFEGVLLGRFKIELIDVLGQVVLDQIIEKNGYLENTQINVNEIASGNYWIRTNAIEYPERYIQPIKIIITR
jgi:hypothetical protein